jgi:Domain of unknown function (DUF5655)
MIDEISPVELSVTKCQIAFRRPKAFALGRMPGKYLHGKAAPLVLTISMTHRDASPRWKEIVEPRPGRFTPHLELFTIAEIDDEVRAWLRAAETKIQSTDKRT